MKQLYFTLITLFFTGIYLQSQTLYVKHDAAGANTGKNWADAYNDLQSALNDVSGTDIWISAGTYVPGTGSLDTFSTFLVAREVNILGGFVGTENSPDERVSGNTTTLSGDLAGDDVPGNNDANREDNAIHIMVADTTAGNVSLDGLTFTGGDAHAFISGLDDFYYRGSGIYAQARLTVTNCNFTGNVAGSGAGVFIRDNWSAGSVFQNCQFIKNTAYGQASLFMLFTNNIEVTNCNFFENNCNRGALYPNECDDIRISGCDFLANVNAGGYGGAFFNWQSTNIELNDCNFISNSASNGGAIYSDNRNFLIDEQNIDNFILRNCTFEGQELSSDGWGGGAIYAYKSSMHAMGCTFKNNKAPNTGGAIYNGGEQKRSLFEDCLFEQNEAGGGWGGGIANYGDTTFVSIKRTIFKKNMAATSGGGATVGFGADVLFEECSFEGNNARFGAAVYSQNDSSDVNLLFSDFILNIADDNGGAVLISGGSELLSYKSKFEGNQAEIGGAIFMSEDSLDLSKLTLENTIFNFNIANSQGGALNIGNANSDIVSCLFVNNAANDIGTGGAVSMNAWGAYPLQVSILNSTFADNAGELSAGIATWTTDTTAATLTLQNNAFVNKFSPNYGIEGGNTTIVSNGGNFSDNSTTVDILNHVADINNSNEDPMFLDPLNFDYHLLDNSPFIDAGVDAGAPDLDLDSNPRIGRVDIGAYEHPEGSPTFNIFEDDKSLTLAPNPAIFNTILTVENDWTGAIELEIVNNSGQLVRQSSLKKIAEIQKFPIEISDLKEGIYYIILKKENEAVSKRMVKL